MESLAVAKESEMSETKDLRSPSAGGGGAIREARRHGTLSLLGTGSRFERRHG
jgi:hypothetical protein